MLIGSAFLAGMMGLVPIAHLSTGDYTELLCQYATRLAAPGLYNGLAKNNVYRAGAIIKLVLSIQKHSTLLFPDAFISFTRVYLTTSMFKTNYSENAHT